MLTATHADPFEALAQGLEPKRRRLRRTWPQLLLSLERGGGIWSQAVPVEYWPDLFSPLIRSRIDTPARPGWFFRWLRQWWDRRRPPAGDWPGMAPLLECQARIAEENLGWAMDLFRPFWDGLPVELIAVSRKAVAWRLSLEMAAQGAAGDWEALWAAPGYVLRQDDPIGDFVSLHLGIERLVTRRTVLPSAPRGWEGREFGGIRNPDFIKTYVALTHAEDRPARGRRRLVDRLIDHSPLTRLVYADVVDPRRAPKLATAAPSLADWGRRLAGLCGAFSGVQGASVRPVGGVRRRWWLDLWLSHLARTIIAVLGSPPANHEDRVRAERRLATVRKSYARAADNRVHPAVQREQEEVNRLRRLGDEQRLFRAAMVCAVFASGEGDGRRNLHMHVLDMLLRHLCAADGHLREAVELRRQAGDSYVDIRDHVLKSGDSPLYARFIEAVTGMDPDRVYEAITRLRGTSRATAAGANSGSSSSAGDWLRDRLSDLLDPRCPTGDLGELRREASRLERDTGVMDEQSLRLWSRFGSEEEGGLELWMPDGLQKTLALREILAAWQQHFENATVAASGGSQTSGGGVIHD